LSAPIQFLSQAEMRAKQLEGLGIDENDISEVSVSVTRQQTPPSVPVDCAQSSAVPTAPQSTSSGQTQSTASDKEKKGAA